MRRSIRIRAWWRPAALTALALAAGGCTATDVDTDAAAGQSRQVATPSPTTSGARVHLNVRRGAPSVPLGRTVRLSVADGTLTDVTVRSAGRPTSVLTGRVSADEATWTSTGRLLPDRRYTVVSRAVDAAGTPTRFHSTFHTQRLRLDQQTYPSFYPKGGTFGVAMPAVIRFDVPVTDRASIERHLSVTSRPAQTGAFHWISDQEVHWRPRSYWKPGTKVTVTADIAGVPAGNGIYGQLDRETSFTVGRSLLTKVGIDTHQLKVYRGGRLLRTLPTTTGMPGFTTRSGVKVIVEKDRRHDMNSETIGLDPNGPNGYNLKGVEYAMRLTYSGEFIHAAPWSVGSQGRANVSHGCTGLSTSNAAWLYNLSMVGDPVEYTGSDKPMTLTNGFGDWNLSWSTYRAGSALA